MAQAYIFMGYLTADPTHPTQTGGGGGAFNQEAEAVDRIQADRTLLNSTPTTVLPLDSPDPPPPASNTMTTPSLPRLPPPPPQYGHGFFSFFSPAERRFTAAASLLSSGLFLAALGLVQRLSR